MNNDETITYFAETDSRNKRVPFGIKAKDRTRHVYVIGKTGMGKSTLLENMAVQDIQNGEGLAFIDPHGKTADLFLDYVPKDRMKDVLYFAPFDTDFPIAFNVMEDVGYDKRHLVVSGLMSAFKKIWEDAWSARMEYILSNTLLALLEYPGATMLSVNRMYADKDYRKKVVDNVKDPTVRSFWVDEFAKYTERFAAEATPAIQNKVGQFTSNPLIRNIIGQSKSTFDIRKMMDEKKILIINLSKGRVGETNANLLGSMLVTKIYLAAMSRADLSPRDLNKLPYFYLYVDEFQSFANESFADILSEARKYKLSLTIAHQYVEQMSEEVRAAVFGNVGTMISFRVGAIDSELLEKEYAPVFTAEDMVNLGFAQIYLKLMIDGVTSPPFSARTLPPIKEPEVSLRNEIIELSRSQFAAPRAEVEKTITDWHATDMKSKPAAKVAAVTTPQSTKTDVPVETVVKTEKKPTPAPAAPKNPFKDLTVTPQGLVINKSVKPEAVREVPPKEIQKPKQVDVPKKEFAKVEQSREVVTEDKDDFVSLNALKMPKRTDAKGPSAKNLADLKLTLQSVLKKAQNSEAEKKPKVEIPVAVPKEIPKPTPVPKPLPEVNTVKTKEVPEDILKKVLDVT